MGNVVEYSNTPVEAKRGTAITVAAILYLICAIILGLSIVIALLTKERGSLGMLLTLGLLSPPLIVLYLITLRQVLVAAFYKEYRMSLSWMKGFKRLLVATATLALVCIVGFAVLLAE